MRPVFELFFAKKKSLSIERIHLETFSLSLFFDSKQWLFSLPSISSRRTHLENNFVDTD